MRTLALALVLSTASVFSLAQNKTTSSADDKSMILALEGAWNQAEIHHDATAAAAIMADTFISVDHHGALQNKSQYLTSLKDLSFKPRRSPTLTPVSTSTATPPSLPAPTAPKEPTMASPSSITDALPTPG